MKKDREHRTGAPEPSRPATSALQATPWLAILAPACLALIVHRRVLGLFFSPDDLIQLERTRGLVAQTPLLWRVLSLRLYGAVAYAMFGVHAAPYHAVALLLHAVSAGLVTYWALRLGATRVASVLAGALFAAASVSTTTVSQFSTMSELMALPLSLFALLAFERANRAAAALGVPLHVAALLSKENVALVPLVALVDGRGAKPRPPAALVAILAALAASIAFWCYIRIVLLRHAGFLRGEAYGFGLGSHLVTNLLTYAAWSLQLSAPPLAPGALVAGGVSLLALVVYAWLSGSRPARAGLALWFGALVPVLPLQFQVHPHYAYVPLAGWCLAVSCAFTNLVAWLAGGSRVRFGARDRRAKLASAWTAAAVVLALAFVAERQLSIQADQRIDALGLPKDSMLRKMKFAENAYRGLGALGSSPARLVIVTPPGMHSVYSVRTGKQVEGDSTGGPRYTMFDAVLDHGRALRALFPQLTDVRLVEHIAPADTGAVFAFNRVDGTVVIVGSGPRAPVEIAHQWIRAGLIGPAGTLLEEAGSCYPRSAELALAAADVSARDRQDLELRLRSVMERFPGTAEALEARRILDERKPAARVTP